MADKKISALTASTTPLAGTEVLPIVQGASTVKVSVANLTAGRPVATGIITATAPAASQAVFTGWAPTGGASTSNGSITFGAGVGAQGYVSYDATGPFVGALYLENTYDDNSATIRFRLRGVDRIIAKGNGDVSIASGNVVMDTAGKGIDFSANANAPGMSSELLDWYEEGTWTPTDASGAGLTFAAASGNYTRMGNVVFLFGFIQYPVTASSDTATIGGLPFTASSSASATQGAVTYTQVATVRSIGVQPSNTTAVVYTLAGGVATNADMGNTALYFNATYFV
jgi:hypothetical protein